MGFSRFASSLCVLALALSAAQAGVMVIEGPTPIQEGEAKSAGDITVVNEKLAFALAVGQLVYRELQALGIPCRSDRI